MSVSAAFSDLSFGDIMRVVLVHVDLALYNARPDQSSMLSVDAIQHHLDLSVNRSATTRADKIGILHDDVQIHTILTDPKRTDILIGSFDRHPLIFVRISLVLETLWGWGSGGRVMSTMEIDWIVGKE